MNIEGLYQIKNTEREKLIGVFIDAFGDYPKLQGAFPSSETKQAALEASVRYYIAYDMKYGRAFALDEEINEGVTLVASERMNYSPLKHFIAGSYSAAYRAAMNRLSKEERQRRKALFVELDALEKTVDLPRQHLYVDFLGVKQAYQRQGRGRKLMEKVCVFASEQDLPIMLFTNTDEDVAFYQSLGFEIAGITKSERFKFISTYLVKYPSIDKVSL